MASFVGFLLWVGLYWPTLFAGYPHEAGYQSGCIGFWVASWVGSYRLGWPGPLYFLDILCIGLTGGFYGPYKLGWVG